MEYCVFSRDGGENVAAGIDELMRSSMEKYDRSWKRGASRKNRIVEMEKMVFVMVEKM
jgi:hypothetical protein